MDKRMTAEPAGSPARRGKAVAAIVVLAVALASIAFRAITGYGHQQTAALFIGIPAILALVVIFGVSPESPAGVACKTVTLGLLVSLVFLGEGFLCVFVAAPLFYLVALVLSAGWHHGRTVLGLRDRTLRCCALLTVLPFALEGLHPAWTVDRDEVVVARRIVAATASQVGAALARPPRFERAMPPALRAGFPRAVDARVERRDGREHLRVGIRGGELRLDGTEPPTGDLVLRLEERTDRRVRWSVVSDDSHTTHYLRWRESTVEWRDAGGGTTEVVWTLRYSRDLDPAWYFGPLERFAASLAAGYLIDAVATP